MGEPFYANIENRRLRAGFEVTRFIPVRFHGLTPARCAEIKIQLG